MSKAVFTVITKSYLAYARVMASKLKGLDPDLPFFVFLADRPDGCFDPRDETFEVVALEDYTPVAVIRAMTGYYTGYELCNALKAFAHLHIVQRKFENWIYLDADIYLCGDLEPLFQLTRDSSIVLTPHFLLPDTNPQRRNLEVGVLHAGVYNGGFVGLKASPEAISFLEWWKERLIWNCFHDARSGEVDQGWLSLVPVLFSGVHICRWPSVNVAYWNIHERPLILEPDGSYTVDGRSLPFLHFSGWDWRQPTRPTRHYDCDPGPSSTAWNVLADSFGKALEAEGNAEISTWPYSFALTDDGTPLTQSMRKRYWERLREKISDLPVPSIFEDPRDYMDGPPPRPSIRKALLALVDALRQRIGEFGVFSSSS